jgi:O-antigen/teichoic acid export membrane protein
MRMEYDALLKGFVHPVSLIVALAATRLFGFTVHGVFIAHAAAECVLMVASVFALNRHFPFGAVVRGLRGFVLDREMLKFAIPQGVSMTFNYYQNHIDVIMLSGFGASKLMVACYGTAARLLRELRQIRVVFSSALAPVFARQRAAGDLRDIEDTLGQLSRWTTTLVALVILPLVVLRTDLLAAIDKGYAVNTTFVVILLIVPYVNCALGLAGNSLVYARRSGLNLANNLGAAMLGTGLNLVLIPRYGLTGAAISSAVSTIAVFTAYVVEIRVLERIHWQWRTAALPHLGTAVCLGLLALFGDPGTVGTLGTRIALGVGVAVLFSVLMLVLGHPDYRALARRLVAGRGGPAAT